MKQQLNILCKLVSTIPTTKWLLHLVISVMQYEAGSGKEGVLANLTAVVFLLLVAHYMFYNMARLLEGLGTERTLKYI